MAGESHFLKALCRKIAKEPGLGTLGHRSQKTPAGLTACATEAAKLPKEAPATLSTIGDASWGVRWTFEEFTGLTRLAVPGLEVPLKRDESTRPLSVVTTAVLGT